MINRRNEDNEDSRQEYLPSLSCYFKIIANPEKRVRIKFDKFDFQPGIDKGIVLNSPGKNKAEK